MQKDLDNAKKLQADKNAELDQAKQDLQATDVNSPVDGILVARRGGPGEPVNPAIPDLLQIAVDLGALEVVFDMPPDVAGRLKSGYPVQVILAEMGGEPLAGNVKSVQAGQVVAAFANPNPAVKPGVTAQVRFKLP
jgi:multidrug resistance efflux pump